ncbi:hypothetical protein Poli38472_006910 [Pythium oligandrum]|uniref:Protein kinase domain-containing protein n=1 Tax=Pythium oligandrum TaxID=41045 RepID=A0A8K1C947_PYTOL|nr:hypothetical protein Poli38472_006910 [Pythium oligandrum]|eukprot:TMW58765.1 hypothetical protein Poli38472_006910 [Pythium oligandrum]
MTPDEALFNAAQVGDINFVIYLVQSRRIVNLNYHNSDGWTPLMIATRHNHKDIVAFLIHSGADVEARGIDSPTALCVAAGNGHLKIVQLLVDSGAAIDRAMAEGLTPLLSASAQGHADVVLSLVERGAALDHQSGTLETALHLAVRAKQIDVIKTLVQGGASVRVRDNNLSTPVMVACKEANVAALTAIFEALKAEGEQDTITDVLEVRTFDDRTPLIWAAGEGLLAVVRVLLNYGALLEGKDDTHSTALTNAVKKKQVKIAKYLVEQRANINHADLQGDTPLIVAASTGSMAAMKLLLKAGAKLQAKNQGGFTPLHAAAVAGHCEIVKLLVKRGAALEARTNRGYTPLLHAAEQGHTRVVQCLFELGASIDVRTHDGKTPLFASCHLDHDETSRVVLDLVTENGLLASLNAQDLKGWTALHCTAANGDVSTTRLLVERGAGVNIINGNGLTPLHMAFLNYHDRTTQILMERGGYPLSDDDSIWPISAIEELLGRPIVPGRDPRPAKRRMWFVTPSSVRFVYGQPTHLLDIVMCSGIWFGAPATILRPLPPLMSTPPHEMRHWWQDFRKRFFLQVARWYPLNHPHLLKLYGACHLPDHMLLVAERVPKATLREYIRDHPCAKWTIMHQVALAVQYLHERNRAHKRLRGDTIHVTEDGVVKVSGMNDLLSFHDNDGTEDIRWQSPQVLGGGGFEYPDDIYSLGMCIIEATTGEPPYSGYDPALHKYDLRKWISHGMPPDRSGFSDGEWDLVTRMIAFARFHRPSISDVVRDLGDLARVSQATDRARDVDVDVKLGELNSLLSVEMKLDYQALERLNHLRSIHLSAPSSPGRAEESFRRILTLFTKYLAQYQTDVDVEVIRFIERRHEDDNFSLHNDIDRLARELGVDDLIAEPIHEWRETWHDHRIARMNRFEKSLTETELAKLAASTDRIKVLTCLYFELRNHSSSYASVRFEVIDTACQYIKHLPDIRVADWFLPHYEIDFDQTHSFASGGFGSVHRGTWMSTRVVVKKAKENKTTKTVDPVLFEREVEIWYQLDHPHVVQLFGACHLPGEQFLVCEDAENGPLDEYLRRDTVCRRRVVWQHLYEAAVALQYLHYKGILHRDLKCNNILIGSDGNTKLADFGLSSVVGNERDSKSHAKGAPRWKAPEVLRGEAASEASDVYGLAMCIVEAVTGKVPWGCLGGNQNELYDDPEVREFVKDGHRVPRPTGFDDAQWELIEQMTEVKASKRLQLDQVADAMRRFALEEAAGKYERTEPEAEHDVAEPESSSSCLSSRANSDSGSLFG